MKHRTSSAAAASNPQMISRALRHPARVATHANSGRNTSCPVAELAVSRPTISPRRELNQRNETVAASTNAVKPVPTPTTSPHSNSSCQSWFMASDRANPLPIRPNAHSVTLRMPKRLMNAAANGPMSPNSTRRVARAEEIAAVDQPNSRCSGSSSTPGAPTAAAVTSMVRKVVATTTQP
jgi:hypothetical protein